MNSSLLPDSLELPVHRKIAEPRTKRIERDDEPRRPERPALANGNTNRPDHPHGDLRRSLLKQTSARYVEGLALLLSDIGKFGFGSDWMNRRHGDVVDERFDAKRLGIDQLRGFGGAVHAQHGQTATGRGTTDDHDLAAVAVELSLPLHHLRGE